MSAFRSPFYFIPGSHSDADIVEIVDDEIDAQKGVANGIASLDSGGRLPASQLTLDAMEYLGAWNVATNTPTLVDGVGNTGDFYRVSVGGTRNLGSGAQTWAVGDSVIYNSTIWQKIPAADLVTSVASRTGDVVIVSTDLADFVEATQDAIGAAVANSARVTLTYVDGAPSFTADLVLDSVTVGYMHSTATARLFGRTTAAAGAGEQIAVAAELSLASLTLGIAAHGVTAALFRQSVGLSVVGVTGSVTADVADITASADGQVLRRSSSAALAFGTLLSTSFADNTIVAARLSATATNKLFGRSTAAAGAGEEIGLDADMAFSGGNLRVGAFTGDITKAAGALATSIGVDKVVTAMILNANVTLAKIVNASAQYVILGRSSSGAGVFQEVPTSANVFTMLGSANNAAILSNIGAFPTAGGTITGVTSVIATGGTSATDATFGIQNTSGGNIGPTFAFFHNSASPAVGDFLGPTNWFGKDSGGNNTAYAALHAIIVDPTDGSEDGRIEYYTVVAGTFAARIDIGAGIYHPSVTGGDKGDNTLNFGQLYENNARVATQAGLNVFTAQQTINANVTAAPSPTFNSLLQLNGVDNSIVGFQIDGYGAAGRLVWVVRAAEGTQASKTAVQSGRNMFQWIMYGYDGSAYQQGGSLSFQTTEIWDGSHRGSRWQITGTLNGTTAANTALFVQSGVYSANATDPGQDNAYFKGFVRVGQFTVATLPAAATAGAGAKSYVTDALAPAFGAAVAGGGAVGVPVFSTGAAWNVG